MRKPFRFALFFLLIPLFSSCRGTPAVKPVKRDPAVSTARGQDDKLKDGSGDSSGLPVPQDGTSSPAAADPRALLPVFEAAPGVGVFTADPRDPALELEAEERESISRSFRKAYAEALSRGLPLEGVLGGDRVHAWPSGSPLAWVQNWKSSEAYPNSWGLPNLVLAIRGFNAEETFIVRGPILDAYGKSGGRGGANGAAGYGPPLSDAFPYGEGIAQRFGEGLIAADASGQAAFIPRDPPAPEEGADTPPAGITGDE
jgi:hypothetical protein